MPLLRRHRAWVVLARTLAVLVVLVVYRLRDQKAVSAVSNVGLIMMVGIVVSNGVLLVEHANDLRRHGLGLQDAVILAGRTRLRPIVMTSLTLLAGLFPMALGIDVGSEANAPLARAVTGGLAVSTALTLILIPTLYVILEERFPRRVEGPDSELALQGDHA